LFFFFSVNTLQKIRSIYGRYNVYYNNEEELHSYEENDLYG